MSTRSLRRSRRAPKKQLSDYNVGDRVEIDRNNVKLEGRLAQLLTEGSSVHPRWLVKFEGPYKDEEVYEHTFTLLEAAAMADPDAGSGSEAAAVVPTTKNTTESPEDAVPSTGSSSSSNQAAADSAPKTKTAAAGAASGGNTSPSEESSTAVETDNAKVSAREERSRRRQAMIDEFGMPLQLSHTTAAATTTTTNTTTTSGKRKIGGRSGGNKRQRRDNNNDDQCLKIKLLTGTLYLYRGKHRRAEFVRRV